MKTTIYRINVMLARKDHNGIIEKYTEEICVTEFSKVKAVIDPILLEESVITKCTFDVEKIVAE